MDSSGGRTVVFGHADGDGYLATEVSRHNLSMDGWSVTDVIVDPKVTPGYRFWERDFLEWDFAFTDLVVSVDIMFSPKDPATSFECLTEQALKHPDTNFLIIDHHPLVASGAVPANVHLRATDSVINCCYGQPNDLMVIASICDDDEEPVRELITEHHRILANGITRASRDKSGVAGKTLMQMLANQHWAWFYRLGSEPGERHKSARGSRSKTAKSSPALEYATRIRI